MPPPIVSTLPPAPLTTDSKPVFNSKSYVFVGSLSQFVTEVNALATWMNENPGGGGDTRQNNLTATTDPTINDDDSLGYEALSQWVNTITSEVFVCLSAEEGAAVWEKNTLTVDELGNLALVNATTVGLSLAQVANPSAIRFIRVNADNTVSLLTDTDFRTAIGASTLVNFTEGKTGTVTTLTATGAETNLSIGLITKGTGAIVVDTAGDARGSGAVDLQRSRSNTNQVASGTYSFIVGANNRASMPYTYAFGDANAVTASYSGAIGNANSVASQGGFAAGLSNNLTGNAGGAFFGLSNVGGASLLYCFASGSSNTVNANASGAIGNANTVTGNYAFTAGRTNSLSNDYQAALGRNHTLTAVHSIALGYYGTDRGLTSRVYSANQFSANPGTGQTRDILYITNTSDATPKAANNADAASPSATNTVTLPNNSTFLFTGKVVARHIGNNTSKAWAFSVLINRGANAAATSIQGSADIETKGESAGASGWTISVGVNTTLGGLEILVTGAAATNIRWFVNIETDEVTDL